MILKSILYRKDTKQEGYPFQLPLLQSFDSLHFQKPVTILVGENGTGKSTLLEAIADQAGSVQINRSEKENTAIKKLAKQLKLTWSVKTKKGFFLNAEDFVSFVRRAAEMKETALQELANIEVEYKDKSAYAKSLASLPHNRTLSELKELYNDGLEFR